MKLLKETLLPSLLATLLVLSAGCGDGKSKFNPEIPGVQGPTVTIVEQNVLITTIMDNMHVDAGFRYYIPDFPNSYIEISPDPQGDGTFFSISMAITDLFQDYLTDLEPQTLPGGRAFPGLITGKLPAVAYSIEEFQNISFYIGKSLFGLFIPVSTLDFMGENILPMRFYSGNNRIGNVAIVGKDENGENSGILLMIDMSDKVKAQLKSYMKIQ